MKKLVFEAAQLGADMKDLTFLEAGVYVGLLAWRIVDSQPQPIESLLDMLQAQAGQMSRRHCRWVLRQLEHKGKITISGDDLVEVKERRYRHQLIPGKVV